MMPNDLDDKFDLDCVSEEALAIQDDWGRTPVHESVHAGNDIIQDLASFTVRDFDGKTVLHEDSQINVPIPPNTIDKNGRTPLHTTVIRSVMEYVKFSN